MREHFANTKKRKAFYTLGGGSGLSFLRKAALRFPKNFRVNFHFPQFFDRCGTRTVPYSATGSGTMRAPTNYARRSHNTKNISLNQSLLYKNKRTPSGVLLFLGAGAGFEPTTSGL